MIRTWVIGGGGLLGGSILAELGRQGYWHFSISTPFSWNDPRGLNRQFVNELTRFFSHFERGDHWQIIWAAGKSTMRTPERECQQETAILQDFLLNLTNALQTNPYEGYFGFASTAGGIYTQSHSEHLSESSPVSPSTPYAKEKLAQEALLSDWATQCKLCTRLIIGRLSTLYGMHQDQSKKQGLISAITQCISLQQPLPLFVPLETKRDYLWSEDAARMFLWHLQETTHPNHSAVRLIAQEESISIAAMLDQFKAITGKSVEIIQTSELPTGIYPLEIHFQSQYPVTDPLFNKLSLTQGIEKIVTHHL
jgi:UDP-glucose 4-epimerase